MLNTERLKGDERFFIVRQCLLIVAKIIVFCPQVRQTHADAILVANLAADGQRLPVIGDCLFMLSCVPIQRTNLALIGCFTLPVSDFAGYGQRVIVSACR